MKSLESLGCPNCETGRFERELVGCCMVFLSGKPGDALIKELFKTVVDCDECEDAPTFQTCLTDIVKDDARTLNSYR